MGGRGSGRYRSYGFTADTCEEYRAIDLAWMRRRKILGTGSSGRMTWSRGEQQIAVIEYRVEERGLRLTYKARERGGDWQSINELIPFVFTSTNFGGRRRWFLCPSCGGRCRIIYGGMYFRCRQCHTLKYESQYEHPMSRASSQQHKLRERLGHSGPLDDPFPPKPKGMHWKTYWWLEARDEALERRSLLNLGAWLDRH